MISTIDVACVVGTRPEVIKMAPVVKALRASGWARCHLIATAQHRGLLDQTLAQFELVPDVDLNLMTEGQSLVELTTRLLPGLSEAINKSGARCVLAQGDTATVYVAALAAYLSRVPFGHVEAGLRTWDIMEPFPEEGFRQMVSRLSRWHFAPTEGAAANLVAENTPRDSIFVTGNTGIDSLVESAAGLGSLPEGNQRRGFRTILLTAHRRENFGQPMQNIFLAVRRLVDAYPDVDVLYPVHPNPMVADLARAALGGHPRIKLCQPLDYLQFVSAMRDCHLVLTDSGGVQEEAPALGKPVLVLREKTERPEAISFGVARLVGTSAERIFAETSLLLESPSEYGAMAVGSSPYGDGHAAPRILAVLERSLAGKRLPETGTEFRN